MSLNFEQALQQGVAAHRGGQLQTAERFYRNILRSQPLHPDANHNLGVLWVSLNKVDGALPLFKAALEANPMIEQFWVSYIEALVKTNQLKRAKQEIKKAKKKGFNARKLEALLSLPKVTIGTVEPFQEKLNQLFEHYQNGRLSFAEELATSITQEFPNHQSAWKVLGGIFGQTGREVDAVNANKKAVALSPQDAEAHRNLGVTLIAVGRLDEAIVSYMQAAVLDPGNANTHYNIANALTKLGKLEEAEASYRQAIALKPDFIEAYNNLGILLAQLSRFNESEVCHTQVLELKPDFIDGHFNLAVVLGDQGRLDEAEVSYKRAIDLKPDSIEAHSNLSVILFKKGQHREGLNESMKGDGLITFSLKTGFSI